MALLTTQRRAAAAAELMEQLSIGREPTTTIPKIDFRGTIDALDAYLNTNAAAINATLPASFRTIASADQKARALTIVVAYRYIDKA